MATNHVQPGEVLTLTAPAGDVASGSPYRIGSLVVIALIDADEGDPFTAMVTGVATVPKESGAGDAWTEGQKIYWDDSADKFTKTAVVDAGDTLVGVATAAAGDNDTTGSVRLDGVVR